MPNDLRASPFDVVAVKRPGGGSMTPEDIDPCLCTHVIYAFSEMDNNLLTPMEKHDLKDGNQAGASSTVQARLGS